MAARKLRAPISIFTPVVGLMTPAFLTLLYCGVNWAGSKTIDPYFNSGPTIVQTPIPVTSLVLLAIYCLIAINWIFPSIWRVLFVSQDGQPCQMIDSGTGLFALPFFFYFLGSFPYPPSILPLLPLATYQWIIAHSYTWAEYAVVTLLVDLPLAVGILQVGAGMFIALKHAFGMSIAEEYLQHQGPTLGDFRERLDNETRLYTEAKDALEQATSQRDEMGFKLQKLKRESEALIAHSTQLETQRRSLQEELTTVKAAHKKDSASLAEAAETITALREAFHESEAARRAVALKSNIPQEKEATPSETQPQSSTRAAQEKPSRAPAAALDGLLEKPATSATSQPSDNTTEENPFHTLMAMDALAMREVKEGETPDPIGLMYQTHQAAQFSIRPFDLL